jgi:hypothetical protein
VWVALLFIFRVFLPVNWHTFWHTVGGFGGYETRKSRHRVGFLVLVVCEWFHCWEIGGMHGISCQSFAYLDFLPFSYFHNLAYLGIRLQHFGILTRILGALL